MAIENEDDKDVEEKEDTAESKDEESDEHDESAEEEGDDSKNSDNDDRDIDAEIEEEERRSGSADAGEESAEEEDDEKPLTRGEFKKLSSAQQKTQLESTASTIAMTLANGNAKLARLALAKWKNRGFPQSMSLNEQLQEAFTIAAHKHLIGTTDEAKRALRNKGNVRDANAQGHRDAPNSPSGPKLSKDVQHVLAQDGFKYNPKTKRLEKAVRGGLLVKDATTKGVKMVKTA